MPQLRNIFIPLFAVLLTACNNNPTPADSLRLEGAWVLRSVLTHMGEKYAYPFEGRTLLRIYGDDGRMCECQFMDGPNGMAVTPVDTASVTLIDKGGGEYLYFEGNEPRPLVVLNDSTVTIQSYGHVRTWVRECRLPATRIAEIRRIVDAYGLDYSNNYVFSVAEDELKEENSTLTIITCFTPEAATERSR